jgi:hypothetical protein
MAVIPTTPEPDCGSDRTRTQHAGAGANHFGRVISARSQLASGPRLCAGHGGRCRRNPPIKAYTISADIGSYRLTLISRGTGIKCEIVIAGLQALDVIDSAAAGGALADHMAAGVLYDNLYTG